MGIYDEHRDGVSNIVLSGNKAAAATYIPTVRKFAEVMKGKLDLGANLGMDYKDSINLDKNTIMKVELSPGVTNEMMKIEIVSSVPVVSPIRVPVEIPGTTRCPPLPLSRPNFRMFTQLLGHDVGAVGLPSDTFNQTLATIESTPYISPSIAQGAYCSSEPFPGNGSELFHQEVILNTPFPLMGEVASRLYLHDRWIGIKEPNVFLSFQGSVVAKDAPCTMDFPGFPIFTPDPESLGPGNNFAVCMTKNAGQVSCFKTRGLDIWLVEGSALLGIETLVAGDSGFVSGSRVEGRPESGAGAFGAGELREFAVINWAGVGAGSEAEIVFLYKSDLCPAAVGFFYGGPDGRKPFELADNVYCAPLMCRFPNPGLGPPPAAENQVPLAHAAYFIGDQRKGLAWTGCNQAFQVIGSDLAKHIISSRCFWFELDSAGFPNGRGIHSPPVITSGQNLEGGPGVGAADLNFA